MVNSKNSKNVLKNECEKLYAFTDIIEQVCDFNGILKKNYTYIFFNAISLN